jgi:hypothetical protein
MEQREINDDNKKRIVYLRKYKMTVARENGNLFV